MPPAAAAVNPILTSILVVEDDEAYADIVGEGLRDTWSGPLAVTSVARLSDARARLQEEPVDCVLLDLSLPDGYGLEILGEVLRVAPQAPVVVLTGREEEDGLGAEAVRLGAQDYLVKGRVTEEVVARAVRYAMERKRGEVERAALEARYAREALIADALQRGLVPEVPRVPGLEVGACYLPSEPAGRVGGDWYDVIPLEDGQVAVVVGDVAGHGVHAASLMGQLATAVRAYALENPRPEAVVAALSRLMLHFSPDDMATMSYVLLDAETGVARTGSAGHPPPVLLRADGRAEFITSGRGTVLGFFDASLVPGQESLAPGDTLVLYTDGLVERRHEDLDIGLQRLLAAAEGTARLEPAVVATQLVDELAPREDREDDVAVLVVRVAP